MVLLLSYAVFPFAEGRQSSAERVRPPSPLGVGGKPVPLLPAAPLSPLRKGGKPLQPHGVEPCCSLQKTGRSEVVGTLQARSGWLPAGMGFSRTWNKWVDKWRLGLGVCAEY